MTKKISIYTAFGQFFQLVERTYEQNQSAEEQPTDRYLVDLFPLSDYQNALTATSMEMEMEIKNFQIQTCPTVFDDKSDYPVMAVRRIRSCPLIHLPPAPSPAPSTISTESEFLNEMTPAMMGMFDVAKSPAPTSIETRKINEATDKMISFWNLDFVTIRRKRAPAKQEVVQPTTPIPTLFDKLQGYFDNDTDSVPTLFEKLNGLFEEQEGAQKLPSLFEKLNGLFASRPDIFTTESSSQKTITSVFPLEKYFNFNFDNTANSVSSIGLADDTIEHLPNCMCFSCFKKSGLVWKDLAWPDVPQLPVFAKSPVDSLRLYKCCPNTCSMVASPSSLSCSSSSSSDCSADVEDNCKTFIKTSNTVSSVFAPVRHVEFMVSPSLDKDSTQEDELSTPDTGSETDSDSSDSNEYLWMQNKWLREKSALQMEVIERLIKINSISEKLSRF